MGSYRRKLDVFKTVESCCQNVEETVSHFKYTLKKQFTKSIFLKNATKYLPQTKNFQKTSQKYFYKISLEEFSYLIPK